MKSKASYFSVSLPLIKENFRRFWAIPVISFLVYFLSGVFPILMKYQKINDIASYINSSLMNEQPFYMAAHLFVPVIAAVVLFRYLQSVGSVAVMHSLPFTRSKLFNSNFISGLLMCIAPVLLNGIILLFLSKPAYQEWPSETGTTLGTINVFSHAGVLNWILVSVLIVAVLYSIAVFSGIVTGNMFIHMLSSFFFIFIVTVLYAVFLMYFALYLFGFSASGQFENICMGISPYTEVLSTKGHFTLVPTLFYIGTFILMYVISAVLYARRKLERASDSLVFDFAKPIICYIIAFLGMSLLGVYFYSLGDQSYPLMYAGFAAGAVIFFIIGQMIIMKTPRVFNLSGVKSFVIFAVIAGAFLIIVNYDLTGFESRTPDPKHILSAACSENFDSVLNNGDFTSHKLADPKNLAALVAFQKSVIENKARFENEKTDTLYPKQNINIAYDLKGILDMNRSYDIDYQFYADSPELKQIYESLEYKATHSLYALGADKFTEITISNDIYQENQPIINNSADMQQFIACIEKDLRNMTFEQAVSLKRFYASVEIDYLYTDKDSAGPAKTQKSTTVNIPYSFANTIAWIKAHHYDKDLDLTADRIDYINIYPATAAIDVGSVVPDGDGYTVVSKSGDTSYYDAQSYAEKYGKTKIAAKPLMKITDKAKIQKILASYDRAQIDEKDAYAVEICYQTLATVSDADRTQFLYGYLNDGLAFLK